MAIHMTTAIAFGVVFALLITRSGLWLRMSSVEGTPSQT